MRDVHPLPGLDRLAGGVRLHVVQHGAGTGLPVLLLHGVPTSSYLWRDVQRDMEHTHRTIAPDLVGLGCSERPADGRYDMASQAQLLLAVLDELAVERAAVVGHGLGGAAGVHLTALAPHRVAALVLVDTPLHADTWPASPVAGLLPRGVGEVQWTLLLAAPGAARAYLGRLLARGLGDGALADAVLDQYARPLLTQEGMRSLLALVRAYDAQATEAALRLVAADPPPTLVLWGEQDAWHGAAYGRRLAAEVPGAVLVPLPDTGHLVPEQRPERVAEEIEGFLAEAAVRTG